MSATNLGKVNKIIDPTNPNNYWEIEDKYAREQVVLKLQKTMVNSLPAKPTTYEDWIAMQPFLYYLPITGQDNEYEVWTLFFMGDPTVASDYTDTSNYEWAKCGKTDVDLSNFSTKGHTHEVVTDVAVEDHDYTPQGQVVSQFEGASDETTGDNTHKHTYTPQGSVNSSFSGTQGETQNGTTGITPSKTKKALKKKIIKLESAGVTITPSTANRATGDLESLGAYDASKAVFNGISVSDGALSFDIKKMSTAQTMTGASGSTDATKVTLGGNTTTEESLATGDLEDNAQAANQVMTDVALNDPGHKHNFTPAGSVSSSFSGTQGETSEVTHSHNFQAHGSVMSGFRGLRANLKHRVDNRRIITSPDQEDPGSHIFDWYGIRYDENASSRFKERIGNMDMHRMLPIQTKMRRCILGDDGEVNYYLDDRDSTKRAGSQEGWVETQETFISKVESDDVRDNTEYITKIEGGGIAWNQLYPSPYDGTVTLPTMVERWADDNSTIPLGYLYLSEYFDNVTLPATIPSTGTWYDSNGNIMSAAPSASTAFTGWRREARVTHVAYQTWFTTGSMQRNIIDMAIIFGIDQPFGYIIASPATNYTVEDMKNYLTLNVGWKTYYEYNAGDLLGTKMVGIRTTVNGVTNVYNLDVTKLFGTKDGGTEGHYYRFAKEGMRGAGSACDVVELVGARGTKKIAVQDLGNLSYVYDSSIKRFSAPIETPKRPVNDNSIGNYIIQGYALISLSALFANKEFDKLLAKPFSNDYIAVRNLSKNDSDLTSGHAAWLEGVMMYYELADASKLTFTSLFLSASSTADELTQMPADAIPLQQLFPQGIYAGKGATIEIIPPQIDAQDIMIAAPTLTMKKYVLTQGANLDGSDGQVMVEIPEHWRRVERVTEGSSTYIYAKISPYPQVGWHHVSKNYVAAFEATIIDEKLASTSALVPVDASTPIWGRNSSGKITVNCDLTNSRKPTTVKSGATLNVDGFRAFARARNGATTAEWNGQTWQQWVDVSWLYFIEYATTNSQGPVKLERDANGYMQGGLGDGFSGFSEWASYNNYYPVVPCGITAVLGNNSGEVMLYVNNRYLPVNSYRGIENPFGHLWKLCDGIKYNGTTIYRALNPADYSNAESTTGYVEVGTKGDTAGYVTKVLAQVASGYDERFDGDLTPTAVGGGTTSYYCDYYWRNTGWRACLLGGDAGSGANDGFVYVSSNNVLGIANQYCGSRLCFLPSSEMS